MAVRLVWLWLVAAVARAIAAARKRQHLLRAERELQLMDDRMLEDIGITRSEIGALTRFGRPIRIQSTRWSWS
jgi:uncharacterized protein YjiS (DUF1127 family)